MAEGDRVVGVRVAAWSGRGHLESTCAPPTSDGLGHRWARVHDRRPGPGACRPGRRGDRDRPCPDCLVVATREQAELFGSGTQLVHPLSVACERGLAETERSSGPDRQCDRAPRSTFDGVSNVLCLRPIDEVMRIRAASHVAAVTDHRLGGRAAMRNEGPPMGRRDDSSWRPPTAVSALRLDRPRKSSIRRRHRRTLLTRTLGVRRCARAARRRCRRRDSRGRRAARSLRQSPGVERRSRRVEMVAVLGGTGGAPQTAACLLGWRPVNVVVG